MTAMPYSSAVSSLRRTFYTDGCSDMADYTPPDPPNPPDSPTPPPSALRQTLHVFLPVVRGTLLLLLAVGLLYLAQRHLPETTALAAWLQRLEGMAGPNAKPCFILAAALLSCVFVPRQAIAFAGGFVFGPLWGTTLTTLGTTLGCAAALGFARCVGRAPLERRYAHRLKRFNAVLEQAPFLMALSARLFPSGNNLVFSLLAGLSRIPARPFICGSGLGYIPQNAVFALLGSGARIAPEIRTASAVLLFVVATGLAVLIYRKIARTAPAPD